MKMFQW